ncbi:MAG: glycosyltransferase [Lachnospiraceae bacterium]|nr:glycosyltransferase [Lachnospiraceae bacterium]
MILSISILSNGKSEDLWNCLESAKKILKRVPGELIVTDTGCPKNIRERIERDYADRVINFTWCNDFAAARNAGMQLCKGEWFMAMDDDEWFEREPEELIAFLLSDERNNYGIAAYQVKNYFDRTSGEGGFSWATRLCRLTDDAHYHGVVHEYIQTLDTRCKLIYDYVEHYGYAYADEAEKKAHAKRNQTLLLEAIRREPYDLKWRSQLIADYHDMKMYQELLDLSRESLKICDTYYDGQAKGPFAVGKFMALLEMYQLEEAKACMKRYLEDAKAEPLAKASLWDHLSEWQLNHNDNQACLKSVEEYLRIWSEHKNDVKENYQAAPIYGEVLTERVKQVLLGRKVAAVCRLLAERTTDGLTTNKLKRTMMDNLQAIQWNLLAEYQIGGILQEVLAVPVHVIFDGEDEDTRAEASENGFEASDISAAYVDFIDGCLTDEKRRSVFFAALQQVYENQPERFEELPDVLSGSIALVDALVSIPYEVWKKITSDSEFWNMLIELAGTGKLLQARDVLLEDGVQSSREDLQGALIHYVQLVTGFYQLILPAEAFAGAGGLLPRDGRFALHLGHLLMAEGSKDGKRVAEEMKVCVQELPDMKDVLLHYLKA